MSRAIDAGDFVAASELVATLWAANDAQATCRAVLRSGKSSQVAPDIPASDHPTTYIRAHVKA